MGRGLVWLTAAAIALPVAPGSAAPEPPLPSGTRFEASLEGVRPTRPAPARVVARALAGASDPVRASLRLTRALGGPELPEPPRASRGGETTFRWGYAAGDLDGDGLGDALTYHATIDGEGTVTRFDVTAVAGPSGVPMWTVEAAPRTPIAVPAGDLDGDGADDLTVSLPEVERPSEQTGCAAGACATSREGGGTWSVSAWRGSSGVPMWTRSWDVASRSHEVAGGGARMQTRTVAGLAAVVVSGDHDLDGGLDVVVNVIQERSAEVSVLSAPGERRTTVVTHASVLSGADGEEIAAVGSAPSDGLALLQPVGDAVGDAVTDLVWTQEVHAADALDVSMIDGASLETAWRRVLRADRTPSVRAMRRDLNGDGSADLVLLRFDGAMNAGVLSGRDGAIAWEQPLGDRFVWDAIGDLGGSPGSDLILVGDPPDPPGFRGVRVSLERVDGGTGSTLLATEHALALPDDGAAGIGGLFAGDADGDGVTDVGLQTLAYRYDGTFIEGGAIVGSGRTGAVLLARTAPAMLTLFPAGDADADGTADVLLLAFGGRSPVGDDAPEITLDSVAVSMPGGATLWSASERYDGSFGLSLSVSRDLTGAGGDDLVRVRVQAQGRSQAARVDALDGATGSVLWGVGDPIAHPG